MNKSKLALCGFLAFMTLELISGIYALVSGRNTAMPNRPTIQQYIVFLAVMSVLVGLLGAIVSLVFGFVQKYMPPVQRKYQAALFFTIASAVISAFHGLSYFTTIDFFITLIASAVAGFCVIWLYDKMGTLNT